MGSYYWSQGAMLVWSDPSAVKVVVWRPRRLDPGVWKLGTPGRLRSPQEGLRILLERFASRCVPVEPPSPGRTGREAPTWRESWCRCSPPPPCWCPTSPRRVVAMWVVGGRAEGWEGEQHFVQFSQIGDAKVQQEEPLDRLMASVMSKLWRFLLATSPFSQLKPNLDCWWVLPRRMWRHCSNHLKLLLLEAPAGRWIRVGRGRSFDDQQLLQTASPSSRPGELNFEDWIE